MSRRKIAQGARDWKILIRLTIAAWVLVFLSIAAVIDFSQSRPALGASVAAAKVLNSIGAGGFEIPTPGDQMKLIGITVPFVMIESATLARFDFDNMPDFEGQNFNVKTTLMAFSLPFSLVLVVVFLWFFGSHRMTKGETKQKRGTTTADERTLSELTKDEDD